MKDGMGESYFMKKIKNWTYRNVIAIALVVIFILIYIASLPVTDAWITFGSTSMDNLNGEYYRWFTILFFHYNLLHLLGNSAALLAVGALLSP
ncbi:MAG: rhomboid family intramembrane serine protease, partial [Lachnospiraceae bacterium]|nr:rhomboid family intramembrane serine protease [Lachnospiraceae bacterium]